MEAHIFLHRFAFKLFFNVCVMASCNSSAHSLPTVDFLESVLYSAQVCCKPDQRLTPAHIKGWKIFKPLYDKHIVTDFHCSTTTRIPKIIHHIWLGSPLPEKFARYRQTWQQLHPTWTCILWDDARVAQLGLINHKAYQAATNWGEKSDIVRYELLSRFGGLYIDTDFECVQPFDLLHHSCDFYAGSYPNPGGGSLYVLNGLIGSIPGHPILKRCIKGIKKSVQGSNSASAIIGRTGPDYFYRCIIESLSEHDKIKRTVIFPPTYFYPWSGALRGNRDRDLIMSFIRPESFAVHHWATSWTNDFD